MANKFEDGFPAYDMKSQLLSSDKTVKVGKRAGEKWVRTNKDGKKYAAVPFSHKPFSKEISAGAGGLAGMLKKQKVMNRSGEEQPFTKIFNDLDGNPLSGKVATLGSDMDSPNLNNMVKYQHVSDKGSVSSVYMTYRMISESSSGWQHPGFKGYGIFDKMEKQIQDELENIIKNLL